MAYIGRMATDAVPTIDTATTADELMTALHAVPVSMCSTALHGRKGAAWLRILREAADLLGASYADTMTQRAAVSSILDSF